MKTVSNLACHIPLLVALVVTAGCGGRTDPLVTHPQLNDIERVAQVRRQLRAACGRLRTATGPSQSQVMLLTDAADTTRMALLAWRQFRNDHANSSPLAYAAHPQWDRAATEIEQGIESMLALAEQSKPAESFQVCGQTCGLFVKLNAEASIRRTSDTLFHFRRTAKPLAQAAQAGNHATLVAALPRLLELRQQTLADPVGGSASEQVRHDALQTFSQAVDDFAVSVRNQRAELAIHYANMMRAMEEAYDAYL